VWSGYDEKTIAKKAWADTMDSKREREERNGLASKEKSRRGMNQKGGV